MEFKGEGLKSFLSSIVGGIFGSASKITGFFQAYVYDIDRKLIYIYNRTGSVADFVSATAGTRRGYSSDGNIVSREVTDELSTGSQAASILFRSVMSGFSGLIEEPRLGLSREGSLGAIKGLFKGLVSLIALPVAGDQR